MPISLKFSAAPAVLAIAAVAAAGCGGGSSGQSSGSADSSSNTPITNGYGVPASSSSSAAAAKRVTITTAHSTKLGTYLVNGSRRAIYLFEKDKRGSMKSTCSGACAKAWPPVITTGKPRVAGGVKAAKLTTLRRADGSRQAVYNGWPLYYFAPDSAGTTKGQAIDAFGAEWYVMSPAGSKIDKS